MGVAPVCVGGLERCVMKIVCMGHIVSYPGKGCLNLLPYARNVLIFRMTLLKTRKMECQR